MKEPFIDQRFFARMAAASMRPGGLEDEEITAFTTAIVVRTLQATARDEDATLKPSPDFPGYLHRRLQKRDIFVPFNLATIFPGERIMTAVCELSDAIQLGFGHPICVSGSTTFLGKMKKAADIDFCEYFASPIETLVPAIKSKAVVTSQPYLVAISCCDCKIHPGDEFSIDLENLISRAPFDPPGRPVKLDFVSNATDFGLLPASNIVLPILRNGFENGNALLSFSYQEAVISMTAPPRTLTNVARFSEYILWLKSEASDWLKKSQTQKKAPLKALKRMLSAFLLLGYDFQQDDILIMMPPAGDTDLPIQPVDSILQSLNDGTLARVACDLGLQELRSLTTQAKSLLPDHIVQEIDQELLLDGEIVEEALAGAFDLADGLYEFLAIEIELAAKGAKAP